MFKKLLHYKLFKKEIVILFLFYISLIISFIFGENSTGAAYLDYVNQKRISEQFSINFFQTLNQYDNFSTRHSPILIIILSFFEKLDFQDYFIRLIHLHFCLLLPFFFYKCLKVKYKFIKKEIFFTIVFLIFLSPTFRSLTIWPDSRIMGLLFFTLGIFFFLKFLDEKKISYAILNTSCIVCSAYFSPNFSVFSIFFILKYISFFGFKSKKIFLILLINLILAVPCFYYIFIMGVNFLSNPGAAGISVNEKIIFNNIFNDILITFSIFFFYLLPFLIIKVIEIENPLKKINILFSVLIFLICVFNFDYNYLYSGGGIFFKFSNLVFENNYFFYTVALFAIFICLPLLIRDKFNILIFLLVLLNNPQYTIYHKYFDPFFLIVFFTILNFKIDINKMTFNKNYIIVFFYFLSFLIISNIKYLWKI